MENLSSYVTAIQGRTARPNIVEQASELTSWQDGGMGVSREVTDYRFENGVVIRRTVEQDDVPSDQVCAECWITYEVIDPGSVVAGISPARVVFPNACREAFWLAYHAD